MITKIGTVIEMDSIPTWIAALGGLLVIATMLGASVAVYRTSVQGSLLQRAEKTIDLLRGDLQDADRREKLLAHELDLEKVKTESADHRIKILEDLVTKRKDDDKLRAEIAAVRQTVDENVLAQLSAILTHLQGR